jgi:hypothetical protein
MNNWFCSVLFCSVLFCSVLFCSVLFCSVLFCSVLFCSVTFQRKFLGCKTVIQIPSNKETLLAARNRLCFKTAPVGNEYVCQQSESSRLALTRLYDYLNNLQNSHGGGGLKEHVFV